MKTIVATFAAFGLAILVTPLAAIAMGTADEAALAQALRQAQLPLERGIAVSSREGTPISAKYELEDDGDELQLSVYTMKENEYVFDYESGDVTTRAPAFSEVIVEYLSGTISKVIPIKDSEDLAAARNQSAAMAQAKRSLEVATAQAVSAHDGYRAVSATPELRNGRAAAKVILIRGNEWTTAYEWLDQEAP